MSHDIRPTDWHLLEPLIDRVLDAAPGNRAAVLAEISGDDPVRHAELAGLLEQCERGLPMLDQPAAQRFAALLESAPVAFPPALAERYRMTRELGRGGMATVFLARDLKHGRDVAVKIMRPELAAGLGRRRFPREIGIAAKLRHPNIVPLFDSGEVAGVLYYVMPYEEGHSLRERLREAHPLPVHEALVILRDVCDALAYAHERGIVHRDIKPDNILLAGRHAMVTDFGVARAVTAAATGDTLTTVGGILGTPAYMAPEHASGDAQVDHRVDIYSVGVMAFEMLAGERPFGLDWASPHAAERADYVAKRLQQVRPDVPPALAALIGKCLATRPDDRYQHAGELLTALEALGAPHRRLRRVSGRWRTWGRVAAAVAGAAALAGLLWTWRPVKPAPLATAPRIAVLPFQYGSDQDLAPLAIGLTDNLIGALGDVPGLIVRSLHAVLPYRDSLAPPDVLGRQLDVSWLVGGRLYRSFDRIAASVQLTEAQTGRLIARGEATAAFGDDVRLIEDVVMKVATLLRERLGDEIRLRDWRAGTRSDAAFAAVNRAHQERREANRLAALRDVPGAWQRLRRADAALDSASRADPSWMEPGIQRALVALNTAAMLFGSGHFADSVPKVLGLGLAHAFEALRRDPGSLRAKEVLGRLLNTKATFLPHDSSASGAHFLAERLLREVSEADTTLVDALTVLSTLHFSRGEYEQAYVTAERAYRADAYSFDPQEVLSRLFTYSFEAEEDGDARRWCARYGARFQEDWFAGYCRLTLMVWDAAETPVPDTALQIAARASSAAPRVIRSSVGAQLHTLAAGVLARAGADGEARRVLAGVAAELDADPAAAREPFRSELLEIGASVQLRLGEPDSAAALLGELLRLHPDRINRLFHSRRFRGLSFQNLREADSLRR